MTALQELSKILFLFYILIFLTIHNFAFAEIADYNTVAKGSNPTLYEAGYDAIVQLDETTFNDTVFCAKCGVQCSSYVVEVNFFFNIFKRFIWLEQYILIFSFILLKIFVFLY